MNIHNAHVFLLSRAFRNDPLFLHLFTDQKYEAQSKALIRFIIKENHLSDGLILTDDDAEPSYVAILDLPRNLKKASIGAKLRLNIEQLLLLFHIPFSVLRFLSKYEKQITESAPKEPHYYLTMLGVDPASQGKGIGKKVLQEIHKIADSSNAPYPVALDTENQDNVTYYQKFGYQLIDTNVIDGLTVYCMTRPAKNSGHKG